MLVLEVTLRDLASDPATEVPLELDSRAGDEPHRDISPVELPVILSPLIRIFFEGLSCCASRPISSAWLARSDPKEVSRFFAVLIKCKIL